VARSDSIEDGERLERLDREITPRVMQPHFEIRLADQEYAAAISRVLYESFVEFKPLYTPGGFAATALAVDQVIERMLEGPIWIAHKAGTVLGTVAAVIKGPSVYIRGMAVLPEARGSGTGAALLGVAEKWAADEGYCHVFLSTTPFLHSAIHLYEKAGFRRKDETPQNLFGTPLFTMEKALS
jgi:GNAT superfamily N-acetyltransferase